MWMRVLTAVTAGLVVALVGCQPANDRGPLEGAWELREATYTTPDTTMAMEETLTKILTATHFAFGRQGEEGPFAGGGRYEFDGETYTEFVDYHIDSEALDQTLTFEAEFEGDSIWYHRGNVGEDLHLEEVWHRIE